MTIGRTKKRKEENIRNPNKRDHYARIPASSYEIEHGKGSSKKKGEKKDLDLRGGLFQ